MTQIRRPLRFEKNSNRLPSSQALQALKTKACRFGRVIGPSLLALSFAGVAHAQGTMDFSGAQTLMGTFKTFAMYAGAVICLGGLILPESA